MKTIEQFRFFECGTLAFIYDVTNASASFDVADGVEEVKNLQMSRLFLLMTSDLNLNGFDW